MRTFIQPLRKSVEDEIKVRLDREVAQGLRDYCEFLQSPRSYVVTEVLRKALRKDKAFVDWRDQRDSLAEGSVVNVHGRRKRPPATPSV